MSLLKSDNTIITWKVVLTVALLVFIGNFFLINIFSLMDDNSVIYLPVRMYLSDALHHGQLPYWNPYIMAGIPQHSDMQGAVWNPIALLLAALFHYNISLLAVEYMVYLIIGGLGMYKMMTLFTKDTQALWLSVIVYLFCGYIAAIANFFNWTSSLAFMPWMFFSFYMLVIHPSFKRAIVFGIVCWLMIVCGYPEFFICSCYLLMFILFFKVRRHYKDEDLKSIGAIIKYLFIAALICFVLSLPAFFSYLEFLPYYNRGSNGTEHLYTDCFYPQFLISLFVPSSVYNKAFDVLCHSSNRDVYFGVIPLTLSILFITDIKRHNTRWTRFFVVLAIFIFIFSFGFLTPLGKWVYEYIPLMSTFKWTGAVRIFLIMFAIIAVAMQWTKEVDLNTLKKIRIIAVILLIGVLIVFVSADKKLVFENKIHHTLFIANAFLQVGLLAVILLFTKKIFTNKNLVLWLTIIDLLLNHTIGMGMTGMANVRPQVYNDYATSFYQQNPNTHLTSPLKFNYERFHFDAWKNNFASKIIYPESYQQSNTVFTNYEKLFLLDTQHLGLLREHAFVFSEDVPLLFVEKIQLEYNHINIIVNCNSSGTIVIQQNNYHRWKEAHGLPIGTYAECFMQIPVQKGLNEINLQYDKGLYPSMLLLSGAALVLILLWYELESKKEKQS